MSTRGTLYRCHLCSFLFGGDSVQTEGIESIWAQGGVPLGDRKLKNGEIVQLNVTVDDGTSLDLDTPVRFDVLEEDFLLTGGADDRVVSILGTGAAASNEDFPATERRITLQLMLGPGDTVEAAVARFVDENPLDYADYLLILQDPVESDATHVITWWKADYTDDVVGAAEYYFIVNIAGDVEDQSEPVLNVASDEAGFEIPSGIFAASDDQSDTGDDDSSAPDDGDLQLPAPTANVVDEPSFREVATYVVAGSGVLDLLGDIDATENGTASAGGDATGGSGKSSAAGKKDAPADSDRSIQFDPVEIIAGAQDDLSLGEPPEEFDPVGTRWPFEHWPEAVERDEIRNGPSGFDDQSLTILANWDTLEAHTAGRQYAVCYQITRAIRYGKTMFGPQGFVVIESPLYVPGRRFDHGPPAYFVLPLKERFISTEHDPQKLPDQVGGATMRLASRYINLLPVDKNTSQPGIPRVFGTHDDALFWFAYPFIEQELFSQLNAESEDAEDLARSTPILNQKLVTTVFTPIDAVIKSNPAEAQRLLLQLDHNAFELLEPGKRFEYLEFLITRFGVLGYDELDRTILEIFKSVKNKTEVISIRDRLGSSNIATLIRNVDSNLWSMLTTIGRRCSAELPLPGFNFEFWLDLLQLTLTGHTTLLPGSSSTRITLGNAGFVIGSDLLNDIKQGTLSLVRFIPNALRDLYHLVTKPQQLFEAVYQLGNLWMMVEIAQLPPQLIPPPKQGESFAITKARQERDKAIKTLTGMYEGALQGFLLGWEAAKTLSDSIDKEGADVRALLLQRIRWTILWEVLSMFIGVGEVKAAFNLARVGLETASIAAMAEKLTLGERGLEFFRVFAKTLSRESRFIGLEEEAARAMARLPKADVQAAESALAKADTKGAQTLEQLMAKDAGAATTLIGTRQETEAMALLLRKGGQVTADLSEKAFERLRTVAKLTEGEMLAVMEALPEGGGARFATAVNALSDEALTGANAYANAGFFKNLVAKPEWARNIINGNEKAFGSIYRHASGDAKKVDTMLDALAEVGGDVKYEAKAVQAFVRDVENGEASAMKRLSDGPKRTVPTHAEPLPKTPSAGQPPTPPTGKPPGAVPPPGVPPGVNEEVYDLFSRAGMGDDIAKAIRKGDVAGSAAGVEFYTHFEQPLKDAVDAMTETERGMFRSLVADVSKEGFEKRSTKFFEGMAHEGRPQAEIDNLKEALGKLNGEFRNRVETGVAKLTDEAVADQMGSLAKYQRAGWERSREIKQRIKDYGRRARSASYSAEERARAADRVKALNKELDQLRTWIKDSKARRAELADLSKNISESLLLKDRLASGGEKALYRFWADMKFRPGSRPPVKSTFERYVSRRMGEFRGLSGEVDAAFHMSGEFNLLKAPDRFVTRQGTDLIAMRKGDRVLAVLDNKSVIQNIVNDVSALTRRLVVNLRQDASEFRFIAKRFKDADLDFADAAKRLDDVANRVETILADVPAKSPLSAEKQLLIAQALKDNEVQLLVTNVGGHAESLAPELGQQIQFWDLQQISKGLPPTPPPMPLPAPPP